MSFDITQCHELTVPKLSHRRVARWAAKLRSTVFVMAGNGNICHANDGIATMEARMQTMNISLPEPLKDFVDRQIAAGRYSSVSEYVRELIRNDEKQKAEEHLAALLREGLQSKETALTGDDWKAIRAEAFARVKQAAKRKR